MITGNKIVSIVYGGTGRVYAEKFSNAIKACHMDNMYPIEPRILHENFLDSEDIWETVKATIAESDFCVVFFTFDDKCLDENGNIKLRIRQNVLIELGMAFTVINNKSNIYCVSDRNINDPEIELPSDFSKFNVNRINVDDKDFDSEINSLLESICNKLGDDELKRKSALCSDEYSFDPKRLLDDIIEETFNLQPMEQLYSIAEQWKKNISALTFTSERLLYILERVHLIPLIGREETIVFTEDIKELYKDNILHKGENQEVINGARNLITALLDYTRYKCSDSIFDDVKHKGKASDIRKFKRVNDELDSFIKLMEKEECKVRYNWLFRLQAYNYRGLAELKLAYLLPEKDLQRYAQLSVRDTETALEIASTLSGQKNYWSGYLKYNEARAYDDLCELNAAEGDLEGLEENKGDFLDKMDYAIAVREEWLENPPHKGTLGIMMSYDYFIAQESKLNFLMEYNGSREEIIELVEELRKLIDNYCTKSIFGRFLDMEKKLKDIVSRLLEIESKGDNKVI